MKMNSSPFIPRPPLEPPSAEAAWQEIRSCVPVKALRFASRDDLSMMVSTASGSRVLWRVEGGWDVSARSGGGVVLETIADGELKAWIDKHGVAP